MSWLESSIIHAIEQKATDLKPWTEIIINLTQEELWKNMKWQLKNWVFFEYIAENNEIIIYKPKEKNYKCAEEALKEWFSVEDAIDACSDRLDKKLTKVEWLKERVSAKEKEVSTKEREVSAKEKEVYLAMQSLKFNKWILFLLKNYEKLWRDEVIFKLNELNKIISNYNVIWDEEERENILLWLWALKEIYKTDEEIIEILNKLIDNVKNSKLSPEIA